MLTSTARTQGMIQRSAPTQCSVAPSGKERRALIAGLRIGCVLALVVAATVAMVVSTPTTASAQSSPQQAWPAWEITYRTPSNVQYDYVFDVSCVASGYCMQRLLRVLEGSGWRAIPAAPGDVLGVACVATADCFGVGARLDHAGAVDQVSHVGIFRWNGNSAWANVAPAPGGQSIRALLATNAARRTALEPNLPALAELIPGFDFAPIVGVLAATGTPSNAIERISAEMAMIAKTPEVVTLLSNAGIDAIGSGPADYNRAILGENERLTKAVQLANIKSE